jgi:hypothetical protein
VREHHRVPRPDGEVRGRKRGVRRQRDAELHKLWRAAILLNHYMVRLARKWLQPLQQLGEGQALICG